MAASSELVHDPQTGTSSSIRSDFSLSPCSYLKCSLSDDSSDDMDSDVSSSLINSCILPGSSNGKSLSDGEEQAIINNQCTSGMKTNQSYPNTMKVNICENPSSESRSSHQLNSAKETKFEQARNDISIHCANLILHNDSDSETKELAVIDCSDSLEHDVEASRNCKMDKYSKLLVSALKSKKLSKDLKIHVDKNKSMSQKTSHQLPSGSGSLDLNPPSTELPSISQQSVNRRENSSVADLRFTLPDIFSADSESEEESGKALPQNQAIQISKNKLLSWRRRRTETEKMEKNLVNKKKSNHVKKKIKPPQSLAQIFPDTFSVYSDSEDDQTGRQMPKRRCDNDISVIPETSGSATQHNKRPRSSFISVMNSHATPSCEPAVGNVFSFSLKMSSNNFEHDRGASSNIQDDSDLERFRGHSLIRNSDSSSSESSQTSFDDLIILSDDTSRSSSESGQENYRYWNHSWHRRRHFHRSSRSICRGLHRQGGNSPSNNDVFVDDAVEVLNQVQADEEYARRLQAEFDAEVANESPFYATRLPSQSRFLELPTWNTQTLPEGEQSRGRPTRRRRHVTSNNSGGLRDLLNFSWLRQNHQSGGRRRNSRRGRHRSGTYDSSDYEELLRLGELLGEEPKKTLSRSQIERLPTRLFVPGSACSSDDNVCSVCMCPYEAGQQLRILLCFHEFHKTCIDPWIKNNPTCPICRVEIHLD